MRDLVASIENEYRRYQAIGASAIAQLADADLCAPEPGAGNSVATIVWHVAGNLESRFTDFGTSDGEKPWRDRDAELLPRQATRTEIVERWERGWGVLFAALGSLTDADLSRTVTVRLHPLRIHEALHRSLSHTSYHVGQIVHIAKSRRGDAWDYLSIAPGRSADYNRAPSHETPLAQAAKLDSKHR